MKECEDKTLYGKTNKATLELELVKCRELVKLYEAKINLCNEEISELKVVMEKYKKKYKDIKKSGCMISYKVCVITLMIVVIACLVMDISSGNGNYKANRMLYLP